MLHHLRAFVRDIGAVLRALVSPALHAELLTRQLWRGFRKSDDEDRPGTGFPSHDRMILLAMAGIGMAILIPKAIQSSKDGSMVAAWLYGLPAGLCTLVFGLFVVMAVLGAVLDYIEANCGQPVMAVSFHHGSFWFAIYFWFSFAWIRVVFFTEGTGWHHLGVAAGTAAILGYPTGSFLGLYLGRMPGGLKRQLGTFETYLSLPILIFDLVACLPLLK